MSALPFTGNTVFRWQQDGEEIAATMVATVAVKAGFRVVLLDTADRYHLVEVARDGGIARAIIGPVTGTEALQATERAIAGVDHGSVARQVAVLAIATVAGLVAEWRVA